MKKTIYNYITEDSKNVMAKVDPDNLPDNIYKPILLVRQMYPSKKLCIFSETTNRLEEITLISRERTPEVLKRFSDAHEIVTEAEAKRTFRKAGVMRDSSYLMDYAKADIETHLLSKYSFDASFQANETITIISEHENRTAKFSDILRLSTSHNNELMYKIILIEDNDMLKIQEYFKEFSFYKDKIQVKYSMEEVVLNMKTGMTYHFERGNVSSSKKELKNITTNDFYQEFFYDIPDNIFEDIKRIIAEYFNEKYGFKPDCIDYKTTDETIDKGKTLRAFNFNPMCSVLFDMKYFFNTRFRTYFKRDDTRDQFTIFCDVLEIDPTENTRKIFLNNPYDVLFIKYFKQIGIVDLDNIFKLINCCVSLPDSWSLILSCDKMKYHGKSTDYTGETTNDSYASYRYSFSLYLRKILEIENEANVVNRIINDFESSDIGIIGEGMLTFNKLVRMNEMKPEIIKKIVDEGMSKSNCDMLSEMLSDIRNSNHTIYYSAEEYEIEDSLDGYNFNLAKETDELVSTSSRMGLLLGSLYKEYALSKECNIVLVRDDDDNLIACIEIHKNDLVHVKMHRNKTPRVYNKHFNKRCIEWCEKHNIDYTTCCDVDPEVSSDERNKPEPDVDMSTDSTILF